MTRNHRAAETTDPGEMALDSLALDEVTEVTQHRQSFAHKLACFSLSMIGNELGGGELLVAAATLTAVTGAGAVSRCPGIDDDHLAPRAREREGCRQSGIARTDDDHVGALRQRRLDSRPRRRRLPPPGGKFLRP